MQLYFRKENVQFDNDETQKKYFVALKCTNRENNNIILTYLT